MHTVQKMGREPGRFYHCVVLCGVWVIKLAIIAHTHHGLTVLETELPSRLSQCLMPLKMTGGNSSEATTHIASHFQHLQFSVASLGLFPVILNSIKYCDRQEGMQLCL